MDADGYAGWTAALGRIATLVRTHRPRAGQCGRRKQRLDRDAGWVGLQPEALLHIPVTGSGNELDGAPDSFNEARITDRPGAKLRASNRGYTQRSGDSIH